MLVAAGGGVFVASGAEVLVAAGGGVFVAAGGGVSVGAGGEVFVAGGTVGAVTELSAGGEEFVGGGTEGVVNELSGGTDGAVISDSIGLVAARPAPGGKLSPPPPHPVMVIARQSTANLLSTVPMVSSLDRRQFLSTDSPDEQHLNR